MSLILLSRVATGVVIDGDDEYNSFNFNTLDPDGAIVVFTGIDTSGFERTLDELIWTDPSDGDTYRYDGNNGVYRTAGPGIPAPVYPNITTEYGLKYILEYKDWEDQTIREEIYQKDFSGDPIFVNGQAEPFTLTRENEDEIFARFRGSGATLNLQTQTSDFFSPLFSGDEREYFLIHKEDSTAKWTGWIQPDIYTEPYMPGPYQISVRFSDGLALLKNTPFPDINLNNYEGTASEKNVIIECLKTLYTRLDVWIGLNIRSANMDTASAPIEQSQVNVQAFVEEKNGENTPLSCYDVLEKILTSWNAVIFQEDNHWTIIRESELYGGALAYKVFNYQGTAQSTGNWNTPQTFATAGIKLHEALRESVQAYKNLSVSQEFGGLLVEKNNFAVNGDFEKWQFIATPFDPLWRLESWTYVNLFVFPYRKDTGAVRRVEEVLSIDETNNYINIYGVVRSFADANVGYLESKPQPIKAEVGNVINVSFKMRANTKGSDKRLVEAYFNIALKCGTQWLAVNETTGTYEWSGVETRVRWKVASVMTWENIAIDSLPVPEDGNLTIRLYQIVQVGSVSKVEYVCDFDDVAVNLAENPAIVNQRIFYKTTNPDNFTNALPDLKIELGDALTVLSQNAKIVADEITATWTRPSESPGQPLAKLIAREYLNQYQRTSYKLTGGNCRTSLSLFNRYEDAVNMSGRYFIFSGGTFRAKSGYWNATFLEINQTETGTEIREVAEERRSSPQGASTGGNTGSDQPSPPSAPVDLGDADDIIPIIKDGAFADSKISAIRDSAGDIVQHLFPNRVKGVPAVEEDEFITLSQLPDVPQYGLLSGGTIQWTGTGFVYQSSLAVLAIGDILVAPAAQITLDPSDATLDRFDVIGWRFVSEGVAELFYLKGTAAASPTIPQVDPESQVEGLVILVEAATTTPSGTTTENVYLNNTEWTVSSVGTGTVNPDSTADPYEGTKAVEVTNAENQLRILFTRGSNLDISSLTTIGLYLKLKEAMINVHSLRVSFLDASNSAVSNERLFKIARSSTSYQFIGINLEDFTFTSQTIRAIQIRWRDRSGGTFDGFFMDVVRLQGGVDQPVPDNNGSEGITLNGKTIGGVKRLIEPADTLDIPANWQYIVTNLDVDGLINNMGEIIIL